MTMILPTVQQIEDYLESLEEFLLNSISSATPDLPNVREAIRRLRDDVSRFFPRAIPGLPEINLNIPGLGAFEVPPPPPPPPPPKSFFDKSTDWIADHKWTCAAVGVSIIGTGLLVGYGTIQYKHHQKMRKLRASTSSERRQVVVVLGGDSPLGLPLILDLEKKGYIVVTSVTTPEAVDEIESRCHGYVRALVLDPTEPETIPYFLRSFSSTLSRRFPITAAGDPHASPSSYPYVHSIVSLLTLPSPRITPSLGPLEHLSLRDDYSAYLQASHIVPLQVMQALLPLLRNSAARTRDAVSNHKGRKSIVVCLPATDARVGLPFASAQAMSAAATLRGIEVLRREIRVASLSDESNTMKDVKVVVVDVGAVGASQTSVSGQSPEEALKAMDSWTPSEKVAYGNAFVSLLEGGLHYGTTRKPTEVSSFVKTIVDVVRDGRRNDGVLDVGLALARLREWIRGDRVVVGAGARTYALASHLPSLILDALLNLPHFLISIRNALIPIQPRIALPYPPPVPPPRPQTSTQTSAPPPAATSNTIAKQPVAEESPISSDRDNDNSEAGSEADVESNEGGYGSGVGESWVSLKTKPQELP